MVKSIPHIPFEAIYPVAFGGFNLNTCGDPDCGNYGVAPDFSLPVFRGRGATQRRMLASAANPALSSGLGRYTVSSPSSEGLSRVSQLLEYENDPTAWDDGRVMLCEHLRGNGQCGLQTLVLSNEHLSQERIRLASQNGLLVGPVCGACGQRYLDAPDEFLFNGANEAPHKNGGRGGLPTSFRLIHRPCRGRKGARFTVSVEHVRQKSRRENIRILSELVNGAGINDLRRLLQLDAGGKQVGVHRLYDRLFWLERTLLAYEETQLRLWRNRLRENSEFRHTRIELLPNHWTDFRVI